MDAVRRLTCGGCCTVMGLDAWHGLSTRVRSDNRAAIASPICSGLHREGLLVRIKGLFRSYRVDVDDVRSMGGKGDVHMQLGV